MGVFCAVGFITFFSCINAFLWGDAGYQVHVLGMSVPAYSLVWLWISLIMVIYGAVYSFDHHRGNSICHVIAGWWAANIGVTTLLNMVNYRGIEEAGDSIFGVHGLVLDFLAQGALDLASLMVIWFLVRRKVLGVSIWTLFFCGYLVANLFGHAFGSGLMLGEDADYTAAAYDAYMYSIFTLMLIIQAFGAGGDALLRWAGSSVDLYIDLRPVFRRFISRDLRLS